MYCVVLIDAETVDEDDVNDPEYNIMLDDDVNNDDDDVEEIRNDKATRVSSMSLASLDLFSFNLIDTACIVCGPGFMHLSGVHLSVCVPSGRCTMLL